MRRSALRILPPALLLGGCLSLAACSTATTAASGSGGDPVIQVVAAENFWGSIASQIGGSHVRVVSIITNPNTDPHSYEPTATDARTIASAQVVIENGIGYDPWVPSCWPPTSGADRPRRGQPARRARRRESAPLVQPSRRADRHPPDHSRLHRVDPADSRYFASQRTGSTPSRWRATTRDRRHQGQVRGHAGRRIRIDLRHARPGARTEADHPLLLPQGHQRGHRRDRRRQADHRQPDQGPRHQDLRLQQPERDPRRASSARRGQGRSTSPTPPSPRRWCPPPRPTRPGKSGSCRASRQP